MMIMIIIIIIPLYKQKAQGSSLGQNTAQPVVSVMVFLSHPSFRMLPYLDPDSLPTIFFHPIFHLQFHHLIIFGFQ
jgi:hypothetical protein